MKDAPGVDGGRMCCGWRRQPAVVLIPEALRCSSSSSSVQVPGGRSAPPSAIIFLQLLLNDKDLLGEKFANKPWNNWVNWTIVILLLALSLVLAAQVVLPNLFPGV